jgi:DNA-binding MarR family transcriptional regulator
MSVPLTVSRPDLLQDGSDAEFRRLVHGLLAFAARLESARDGLARNIGMTGIQYTVLISVAHLEKRGGVSVAMVAEHLQLSGAFVTIETGKLANRGLLSKAPDAADRRRVSLKTTAAGRRLLESLAPTQRQVNDVLFEFLDARRFRQLVGMLDSMVSCGDRALSLLEYLDSGKEAS